MNDQPAVLAEREVAARLQSLLGEVAWVQCVRAEATGGADFAVQVDGAGGCRTTFHVYVKPDLRPSTFLPWASSKVLPAHSVPVLVLPTVSPRIAELCRRQGWSWLDLAGNCWLDAPGVLRVERSGVPPRRVLRMRAGNLKTPAAARVIRVLLSPAQAGTTWTQRLLQACTALHLPGEKPVSLGLVNKVIQHLRDQAFVEVGEPGIRLKDPVGLLTAWRDAYRIDARHRLPYFTLLKQKPLSEALQRATREFAGGCVYAAFSAAERQAPQVRQPRTWIYVRPDRLDDFVRAAEAKPVDTGENLVVLLPSDPGVFQSFEPSATPADDVGCSDPVQTYVDLHSLGGRGEEAAQAILEQRLMKAWKDAGIA
jgi:hypothetical protein